MLAMLIAYTGMVSKPDQIEFRMSYDKQTKEHYLFIRNRSLADIYVFDRHTGYILDFFDKDMTPVEPRQKWWGSWPEVTRDEWSLLIIYAKQQSTCALQCSS